MTQLKHTPGPWFIDQYGHVYGWQQTEGNNTQSVVLLDGRHSDATVRDKLLMAAAPELLAALEALSATARTFRNVPKDEQYWGLLDDDALNAAFAAIAKATGEQ